MIIRRIVNAIRTQNWFTVIVEILIVVIGIFLGLQVTEWNDSRKDRAKEREFIVRLHSDTLEAIEQVKPWFNRSADIFTHLNSVVDLLRAEQVERPLSPQECGAIITSNRYGAPRAVLPVIEELMATGSLVIIQPEDMRNAITSLSRLADERSELNLSINHNVTVLQKKYPSLIPLDADYKALVSFGGNSANCRLAEMRSHQGFKNDLFDNIARFHYHARSLQREQDLLKTLLALTEDELNLMPKNKEPAP